MVADLGELTNSLFVYLFSIHPSSHTYYITSQDIISYHIVACKNMILSVISLYHSSLRNRYPSISTSICDI